MDRHLKKLISIRLTTSDLAKLREIARRLNARESEVFRFSLRLAFEHLEPLHNQRMNGRDLIPLFLACGPDLVRHFQLDANDVEAIVNGAVEDADDTVAREDIELLAMLGLPEPYLQAKLSAIQLRDDDPATDVRGALRGYLYQKYFAERAAAADATVD
jgi:hypothetical protein